MEVLAKDLRRSKSITFHYAFFGCLSANLQIRFYWVSSWVHAGLLNHLTSRLLTCFHPEVEWACYAGVAICCWEFNWNTDLHFEYQNCPSVPFPGIHLQALLLAEENNCSPADQHSYLSSPSKSEPQIFLAISGSLLGSGLCREMQRRKHSRTKACLKANLKKCQGKNFASHCMLPQSVCSSSLFFRNGENKLSCSVLLVSFEELAGDAHCFPKCCRSLSSFSSHRQDHLDTELHPPFWWDPGCTGCNSSGCRWRWR